MPGILWIPIICQGSQQLSCDKLANNWKTYKLPGLQTGIKCPRHHLSHTAVSIYPVTNWQIIGKLPDSKSQAGLALASILMPTQLVVNSHQFTTSANYALVVNAHFSQFISHNLAKEEVFLRLWDQWDRDYFGQSRPWAISGIIANWGQKEKTNCRQRWW